MIDEKALRQAAEALAHVHDYGQQSDLQVARVIVATYESAKTKEAEGLIERITPANLHPEVTVTSPLKLGSRLTVEGVEAVVVPAEPTEAMIDAALNADLDIYWSYEGNEHGGGPEDVYRAMLSAAGGER